jgi:hypothetical protein
MPIDGTDISGWQPGNPNIGGNSFVIAKATEGVGYTSASWHDQVLNARAAGRLVGHYHFANGTNTPEAEANYFWSVVSTLWQSGEIVALDIEANYFTNTADPVGWALRFCQQIKALSALTTVIYIDWSHEKDARWNWQPLVDFGCGLWGAAYNSSGFGDPAPWPVIAIWQNSDVDETSGGDDDLFYGDAAAWAAYGTPAGQPAISPQSTTVTPVPEEDIMATIDDLKNVLQDEDILNNLAKHVWQGPGAFVLNRRLNRLEYAETLVGSAEDRLQNEILPQALAGIKATVDPAALAAAIPADIAQEVADELAKRLQPKA